MIVLKIILILSLVGILYQDIKERNVYWFLFVIVALCAGYLYYTNTFFELFWTTSFINIAIIGMVLLVLAVYSKFKLKVSLKTVFGLGDAFLFIGLCFMFPVASFITFFVFSLIFSLVAHFILKNNMQETSVPLAGYMSLFFCGVYLLNWTGCIANLYSI